MDSTTMNQQKYFKVGKLYKSKTNNDIIVVVDCMDEKTTYWERVRYRLLREPDLVYVCALNPSNWDMVQW